MKYYKSEITKEELLNAFSYKLYGKFMTNLEKTRKEKRINKKRTFKRIWNKCKNN